jgi:hypothetical protein
VVPSRWTKHEIEAVHGHLRRHWEDWNIYQSGVTASEDGQALVTASLTRVLPEVAAWAAALPAGVLNLTPWLVPARAIR